MCRSSYTFGMNIYGESGAGEEYFNPGRSATLRTHYFGVWEKTRKERRRIGCCYFRTERTPPPPATFSFSPNIGEREVRAKWIELPYFDGGERAVARKIGAAGGEFFFFLLLLPSLCELRSHERPCGKSLGLGKRVSFPAGEILCGANRISSLPPYAWTLYPCWCECDQKSCCSAAAGGYFFLTAVP